MGIFSRFTSFRKKFAWRRRCGTLALGLGLALGGVASANPTGPVVKHGQVRISPGTQAQIQQLTDRAIIDWNSFSIGSQESVRFLQPSALSVVLNRVTGTDPSLILGTLEANGNIFLINPNGILFGPNSVVNVGGLVASTLHLSDESFLSGDYQFTAVSGSEHGAVVNQGTIRVTDAGYAVLTGPSVINEGTIVARAGNVVLASGEQATLNLDGRDLVHFALDHTVGDGTVLLAPGMMSDQLSGVLGIESSQRADKLIRLPDGSVRMVNSSGTLVQAGEVSVDGWEGTAAGSILLDSGDVTILAGGSVTSASGVGANSDGGSVLVLSAMDGGRDSKGFTDMQAGARLEARGGLSGDGGFAEISGDGVNIHGELDLSAANGQGGSFLLDPETVRIIDGDDAPTTVPTGPGDTLTTIGDQWFGTQNVSSFNLTSTGDVIFDLSVDGVNASNDGLVDFTTPMGALALTITAGTDAVAIGDVNFGNDAIQITGLDALTINTDGGVSFGNSTIDVAGEGDVQITAGGLVDFGSSSLNPNVGATDTGSLTVTGAAIDMGSATIRVHSDGENNPLTLQTTTGNLDLGSSDIQVVDSGGNGTFTLSAAGDLDFGSADLVLDAVFSAAIFTNISAGGRIFSDAADGNPGTFVNTVALDGRTTFTAGLDITLPDIDLTVDDAGTTGTSNLVMDAQGGTLDLSESRLDVDGHSTLPNRLESSAAMQLGALQFSTRQDGDLTIISGGGLTATNALVNNNPPNLDTGFIQIQAGGDVSLGNSSFNVDSASEAEPFRLDVTGNIDLGSSTFNIQNSGGNTVYNVLATGDIDFGTADIVFDSVADAAVTSTFTAGGRIFSDAADGNPNTYINVVRVDGVTSFTATTGEISLPDIDLTVDDTGTNGTSSLVMDAQGGTLNLSESRLDVDGHSGLPSRLESSGAMQLGTLEFSTRQDGDLTIISGGGLTATAALINNNPPNLDTGFIQIQAGGNVSLGNSSFNVDSASEDEPFRLDVTGNIDLGSSSFNIQNSGGNTAYSVLATGDIDFGTADIVFDSVSDAAVTTTFSAGGRIFSNAADGNPNTYINVVSVDGRTSFTATAGEISLPDIDLTVDDTGTNGTSNLVMDAQGGILDLSESRLDVDGHSAFPSRLESSGAMQLGAFQFSTRQDGDLTIISGGDLTATGALVNLNPPNLDTGFIQIQAGGNVSLGNSQFHVDSTGEDEPFRLNGMGNIDLGSSIINIQNSGGNTDYSIVAVGDLDFGTADIVFDSVADSVVTATFSAGGRILSDAADSNPNTYINTVSVDGSTSFTAATGDIFLPDINLTVDDVGTGGTSSLIMHAQGGSLNLSSSRLDVDGHDTQESRLQASTNMVLGELQFSTRQDGDLSIIAGTTITMTGASFNDMPPDRDTGFIQIQAGGDVSLGNSSFNVDSGSEGEPFRLDVTGNIDLGSSTFNIQNSGGNTNYNVLATGNIDFGTADIVFDSVADAAVNTNFSAGGRILSDGADTDAGTFNNLIMVDGSTTFTAGLDIFLPDIDLTVDDMGTNGTSNLVMNAQSGGLNLSESRFQVDGHSTSPNRLTSTGAMQLGNLRFSSTQNGDILIDSGGGITFTSALFNDMPTASDTGSISIQAAGDVNLGSSSFHVDGNGEAEPFLLEVTGNIDLDTANINVRNSGGNNDYRIAATGDLDFGTADITFDSSAAAAVNSVFTAGGRILSDAGDNNPSTFNNLIRVDGTTTFIATGGEIFLPDLDLVVDDAGTSGTSSLVMDAQGGGLNLSESRLDVDGHDTQQSRLQSSGDMVLGELQFSTRQDGDLSIISGGTLTATGARVNENPPDLDTGFVQIQAGGDVSLGSSSFNVDSVSESEPFRLDVMGNIDLGTSTFNIQNSGGNTVYNILATGDIDFGTADIVFDSVADAAVATNFSAGGRILSDGADMNAGTFNNTVRVDGSTTFTAATGDIFLPDIDIVVDDVGTNGTSNLVMDAQGGNLNLSESRLDVDGHSTQQNRLQSSADMVLGDFQFSTRQDGDLSIISGGAITATGARINENPPDLDTGFIQIQAAGDVSLGNSSINVDSDSEDDPFLLNATGNVDLGSSDITIQNSGGNTNYAILAGGNLDLGSADILFDSVADAAVTSRLIAQGSILSDSGDGNPGTFRNEIFLEGVSTIQAGTPTNPGNITFGDTQLTVGQTGTTSTSSLDVRAENGDVRLGESSVTTVNNVSFFANGLLDTQTAVVNVPGRANLAANGEVRANGTMVNAGDIEIFGFDPVTGLLDPTRAVATDVDLDLVSTGNIDLSILSDGNVTITHTGGGTLTTERAGLEVAGSTTEPASIRSNNGNVTITSDGTLILGSPGGDLGDVALIEAVGTNSVVRISADRIVDNRSASLSADIRSSGSVELVGLTSVGERTGQAGIEVQAPSILVDVSTNAGAQATVNIMGGGQYLRVAGNNSDIIVTDNVSGNNLRSQPVSTTSRLDLEAISIPNIEFLDSAGIELGDLVVGTSQVLAVQALGGDVVNGNSTVPNFALDGKLLLTSSGNIGTAVQPVTVTGGTVATNAGGETYLTTDADALTVGDVEVVDHLGNTRVQGAGMISQGDMELILSSPSQTLLVQQADIRSTTGGVGIDLLNGDLQQDAGILAGTSLALKIGRSVGEFDGTNVVSEVNIQTSNLTLEVGGDAILSQVNGDLDIESQVVIGGETYNTTGTGGDLRVRLANGDLTVNGDITSGADVALVTGTDLTLAQGTVNNINLNGNITAAQNLVLLSNGSINYQSGLLTGVNVGLGARGAVGTPGQPVQVQGTGLTVNPFGGNVAAPPGIVTQTTTGAAGVTVNQGVAPPPPPPPPTPGPVVIGPTGQPIDPVPPAPFAQNQVDMVEETLSVITDFEIDDYLELDPTRPPLLWPEDEFLQRKFRR